MGPTSTAKCLKSDPNSGMVWLLRSNPRAKRTGTESRWFKCFHPGRAKNFWLACKLVAEVSRHGRKRQEEDLGMSFSAREYRSALENKGLGHVTGTWETAQKSSEWPKLEQFEQRNK